MNEHAWVEGLSLELRRISCLVRLMGRGVRKLESGLPPLSSSEPKQER